MIRECYLLERAVPSRQPLDWLSVATQTLSAPKFSFRDADAAQDAAAFYRVRWLK